MREIFVDNLLVRIHFIIGMIWWTGLAPWEFEISFAGSESDSCESRQLVSQAASNPGGRQLISPKTSPKTRRCRGVTYPES